MAAEMAANRTITVRELAAGEYALVTDNFGGKSVVLALSETCFTPVNGCAHVVNLENGIGSYGDTLKCRRLTQAEAFRRVAEWGRAED